MHKREARAWLASKPFPGRLSDEQTEAFLEQDLSDLDFSQFKPFDWASTTSRPRA
jgi:predicted DNA binding CopG/RHH family protein